MVPRGMESACTDSGFTVKNNPAECTGGHVTLLIKVVKEEVSKLPTPRQ